MSEKLTFSPTINDDWDGRSSTSVLIGNSGLEFIRFNGDKEEMFMHFTPDNNCGYTVDEATALKYSKIYCAAFYEFFLSWCDEENFLIQPRPRYLVGSTNSRMFHFRDKLFNQDEYIFEMLDFSIDCFEYRIDMEKVIGNPKLIDRLKRIHDRCVKEDYSMGR